MTEITICSSGSNANGYLLKSGNQVLVLELGCKFMEYVEALKDDFSNIIGSVFTHRHLDHLNPSTAKEFVRRGIPVFAADEVIKDTELSGFQPLYERKKNNVGGFTIQTFPTPHNVPNYGFLIETPTKERIVFVTDAMECRYKFKDIDCIMVECNHDDETLLDNLDKHEVSMSHPENHLGLNDCIDFCRHNTSATTKQIILIHMSHTNINETYAMKQVSLAVPHVLVSVAHSGDTFEIESDNF